MSPSEIFGLAGVVSVVLAALVVVFASFKTNSAKVWREEAEAQKSRADRLESDLTEIKDRLRRIEQDNDRLIQLLTSLDPSHLVALRTHRFPPEV
ncbi:hypothetical protein ACIQHZ_31550 [Streptomyces halstedii]|uniref:hypothetical protein n=1 Tax=Streptomyces halstedii TaxID=1944 RepID=UPI0038155540